MRLTSSRHVLGITSQQDSLGRELVVPLYSLVGLTTNVTYRYAINDSSETNNNSSATSRMTDRGAKFWTCNSPSPEKVYLSVGGFGPHLLRVVFVVFKRFPWFIKLFGI